MPDIKFSVKINDSKGAKTFHSPCQAINVTINAEGVSEKICEINLMRNFNGIVEGTVQIPGMAKPLKLLTMGKDSKIPPAK